MQRDSGFCRQGAGRQRRRSGEDPIPVRRAQSQTGHLWGRGSSGERANGGERMNPEPVSIEGMSPAEVSWCDELTQHTVKCYGHGIHRIPIEQSITTRIYVVGANGEDVGSTAVQLEP